MSIYYRMFWEIQFVLTSNNYPHVILLHAIDFNHFFTVVQGPVAIVIPASWSPRFRDLRQMMPCVPQRDRWPTCGRALLGAKQGGVISWAPKSVVSLQFFPGTRLPKANRPEMTFVAFPVFVHS